MMRSSLSFSGCIALPPRHPHLLPEPALPTGRLVGAPAVGYPKGTDSALHPPRRPRQPDMPLLDHFRPPLSERRPWESFHTTWASALADALNHDILPPGYIALEQVHSGAAL